MNFNDLRKCITDAEVEEYLERICNDYTELEKEVEQLQVQLAGCGVAALGGLKNPAKEGDYGWSPAYQDVLSLRKKYEELLKKQK